MTTACTTHTCQWAAA